MELMISVVNHDTSDVGYDEVMAELNVEFEKVQKRNPRGYLDSFEQSFHTHCETVARRLGAVMKYPTSNPNDVVFDFVAGSIRKMNQQSLF